MTHPADTRLHPIATLPAPAARALRGVIFDIDDTVTAGGRLVPEALAAMSTLREAGLKLAAVTGRPLGWVDVLARLLPVDFAAGENGAGWVWRDGERLREGYWDDEATRARSASQLNEIAAAVAREMPEIRLASDQRARRVDLAFDIGEEAKLAPTVVDRLLGVIKHAGARVLVSSVHAHVILGDWDKAKGSIRAAREALDEDLDAGRAGWLFVGDSGNDAAAFAHFPLSVGVANVRLHLARLPVWPAYVAQAERGRGFAEIAAEIVKLRR